MQRTRATSSALYTQADSCQNSQVACKERAYEARIDSGFIYGVSSSVWGVRCPCAARPRHASGHGHMGEGGAVPSRTCPGGASHRCRRRANGAAANSLKDRRAFTLFYLDLLRLSVPARSFTTALARGRHTAGWQWLYHCVALVCCFRVAKPATLARIFHEACYCERR
jgi:hypothetical protein